MKKVFLCLSLLAVFSLSCSSSDDDVAEENVFEQYIGDWSGTYSGDDNGTWEATIDSEGIVSGSGTSSLYLQTYSLTGEIDSDGNFTATAGTVITGTVFTGQIVNDNVTGTWSNSIINLSGTWLGTRD